MATEILVVMLVAIGLTIFAERYRLQPPLVLVLVGLGVSFIPGVQRLELEPETILSIVVPPMLYSAALNFSFFSFVKRLGSILNLSVALVFATTIAVGYSAAWLMPALPLALAFILGAALAPPDAVSAVAIGRQLGLPSRLMTILKGESLVNDAAALALFSVSTAWAISGVEHPGRVVPGFLFAAVVGAALGVGIGQLVDRVRRRLENPSLVTTLSVLVPFGAYALAERFEASGVVAVVFAGFTLSHRAADLGFAGRMQEREVWHVVDALLETFAFAYMGLQLRSLVLEAQADGFHIPQLVLTAAALLVVVIGLRMVWIVLTALLGRARYRFYRGPARLRPPEPLSWAENVVLSWSGMRGVVTLAAAAATPLHMLSGELLAGRSAVVLVAYVVAVATLLLHGLTLPLLVRRLALPGDDTEALQRQQRHARSVVRASARETLAALKHEGIAEAELIAIERLMARQLQVAQAEQQEQADQAPPELPVKQAPPDPTRVRMLEIGRAVLAAQRGALIAERDAQRLDDELLREWLEGLDLEQALLARKGRQLS